MDCFVAFAPRNDGCLVAASRCNVVDFFSNEGIMGIETPAIGPFGAGGGSGTHTDVAIEGFLVPHKVHDDCSQGCLIAPKACDHRSEESIRIKLLKIDGMSGLICQHEEE